MNRTCFLPIRSPFSLECLLGEREKLIETGAKVRPPPFSPLDTFAVYLSICCAPKPVVNSSPINYENLSRAYARVEVDFPDGMVEKIEEGKIYTHYAYKKPGVAAQAFSESEALLSSGLLKELASKEGEELLFLSSVGATIQEGVFALAGKTIIGIRYYAYKWEVFFPQGDGTTATPFVWRTEDPSKLKTGNPF